VYNEYYTARAGVRRFLQDQRENFDIIQSRYDSYTTGHNLAGQ